MHKARHAWSQSASTSGRHGPWSHRQSSLVLVAAFLLFGGAVAGWLWVLATLLKLLLRACPGCSVQPS
jgi:hypothetical protein